MRQKREIRKRKIEKQEIGKRIILLIFLPIICFLMLMIWERSCEKEAHKMPMEKWQSLDSVLHRQERLPEEGTAWGKGERERPPGEEAAWDKGEQERPPGEMAAWDKGEQERPPEKELTQEDVQLLEKQTGLCEKTVRELYRQNRMEEFYELQKVYFEEVKTACSRTTILTCEERIVDEQGKTTGGMKIPVVEDGDILITNCSHFLGWRNGHAAIVVDAGNRQILEARAIGLPSVTGSLDTWETYPSFLILRLKDTEEEFRRQIAEYAKENLIGIPYRLTAGLWGERSVQEGTQCAHLVWSAYSQFGITLKKNSLGIVTPGSLADSEQLMVVQQYGTGREF